MFSRQKETAAAVAALTERVAELEQRATRAEARADRAELVERLSTLALAKASHVSLAAEVDLEAIAGLGDAGADPERLSADRILALAQLAAAGKVEAAQGGHVRVSAAAREELARRARAAALAGAAQVRAIVSEQRQRALADLTFDARKVDPVLRRAAEALGSPIDAVLVDLFPIVGPTGRGYLRCRWCGAAALAPADDRSDFELEHAADCVAAQGAAA